MMLLTPLNVTIPAAQLRELPQSLFCFSWFAFGSQSLEIKLLSYSAVLRATAQSSLRSVGNELLNSYLTQEG